MSVGTPRLSLELLQAAITRLDRAATPREGTEAFLEAWRGAEAGLQQLAGSGALRGQELLRDLRARDLLSLGEAHAIIDLGSLGERVAAGYEPAAGELAAARAQLTAVRDVLVRRGPPGQAAAHARRDAATAPATEAPAATIITGTASRGNMAGRILVGGLLLLVVGVGAWFVWGATREPRELRQGRAAWAAGDRATARQAFAAASARNPALAEPLLYLGRIAREEGDLASARDYLRRAITLEPANPLGHREFAGVLLAGGRADLARPFYERAIRLDPADRTAQGYMGCTLLQLGRPDLAQRFLARAGQGPWSACTAPVAPLPPPR